LFRYRDRFQVPKTPLAFHPRTFLRGLSQDETHRELVYRRFQFQKRSQLFHPQSVRSTVGLGRLHPGQGLQSFVSDDFPIPFHSLHRAVRNRQDDGSGSNREKISSTPLHISGVRPVSTPLAQSSRVYFGGFAPDFPHYISGKEFKKMKTFIVYDLDSQMPVAVGEEVSAEVGKDEG
jgi:hypothetical protein